MRLHDAGRLVDALWRRFRPALVAIVAAAFHEISDACADGEPDEADHIERSAAEQLARYRARQRSSQPTSTSRRRKATA